MLVRWPSFECRVPGKWVLAGEHAVLRGATAVALPHPEAWMRLSFEPSGKAGGLQVEPASAQRIIDEMLKGLRSSRGLEPPSGLLRLESTIPVGAGLGSSAALCVAFTRWVAGPLGLPESEWFEFARALEHRFHGQSSGMDVAAASSGEPIRFSMAGGPQPIGVGRMPRFTFHDTWERARTSDCIQKVKALRDADPSAADAADAAMGRAAELATEGLRAYDRGHKERGLERLAEAMRLAQDCYGSWGLMPSQARQIEEELLQRGARAVKLTGAGGGGFLVALWD